MTKSVLINGVQTDHISAHERGYLYGQSVFETAVIQNGQLLLADRHLKRLELGCKRLNIPCDFTALVNEIERLTANVTLAVLRVTVSMGQGERGYQNPSSFEPIRVLSLYDFPKHADHLFEQGVVIGHADIRLGHQPLLAGIKHGNRLEQIIARSQWQDGWQEALVLDTQDNVIEGTQSNVFIANGNTLSTPDLSHAGVAGVMRGFVLDYAKERDLKIRVVRLSIDDIQHADSVFLTNSVIGLWPVKQLQLTGNTRHYHSFAVAHSLLELMREHEVISTC